MGKVLWSLLLRETIAVPTPFYSFPVHSLSIPSHSSPLLLLPLTILIPTIFATFLEVPR